MYKALAELELMMDRANDLVEFRIEAVLHEMSVTNLCELPDEEPWTVDKFLERTQVRIKVHTYNFSRRFVSGTFEGDCRCNRIFLT